MSQAVSLSLVVLKGEFAVCQVPPEEGVPAWATEGELFAVVRRPGELSVLCAASRVPRGVRCEDGWCALLLEGPFAFSLTGILAAVLNPLAQEGIGIFALSTFDTDLVLLKQAHLHRAVEVLTQAGHSVRAG
jgi:hypothetical protein